MSNQLVTTPAPLDQMLMELQSTQKMCEALMQTPHYKKMGAEGVFAIVQKARTLNINTLDALNGGLYFVNGKVEMSAQMMIQLIRQAGHSVTKDKRSDDTICILHGRRKDNGDTWTEAFSIIDAKRAGIYKNVWEKYPRNMMFSRALSNLARQLFPDTVKGVGIEGEAASYTPQTPEAAEIVPAEIPRITEEQYMELDLIIGPDMDYREDVTKFIAKKYAAASLRELPVEIFDKVKKKAIERLEEKMQSAPTGNADEKIAGE